MSDSTLRQVAIGALAGLLAGVLVAMPATAAAHALVLLNYQPAPWQLAKSTCCGQVLPGFWAQVLPDLGVDAWLGLMSGAALGVLYVIFQRLVPGPTLLKVPIFSIALALPFDIFVPDNFAAPGVIGLALASPWEAAFTFPGPLGTVPPLPLEFRLLLALPVVAAGIGIAAITWILDSRFPSASNSIILSRVYGALALIAGLGLLALPLVTGVASMAFLWLGGD